jgi:hypothetical protein
MSDGLPRPSWRGPDKGVSEVKNFRDCSRIHKLMMFFDPDTRELLRTRPKPIPTDRLQRIRGIRSVGPATTSAFEPIRVQRRFTTDGKITIARQQVAIGQAHADMTCARTHSVTFHAPLCGLVGPERMELSLAESSRTAPHHSERRAAVDSEDPAWLMPLVHTICVEAESRPTRSETRSRV